MIAASASSKATAVKAASRMTTVFVSPPAVTPLCCLLARVIKSVRAYIANRAG